MKIKKIIFLLAFIALVSSCDTNDNNDPNTPCAGLFYQFVADSDGTSNGTFNIYSYQKSTNFNFLAANPELQNNETYTQANSGLRHSRSSIDKMTGRIVYKTGDMFISFQNGSVSQTTFPNGDLRLCPEIVNGNVYFIKPNSMLPTNIEITDETGNTISQNFNINLTASGIINSFEISSTSDNTDNIFYLANTYLLKYNVPTNTMTTMQIDNFSNNNVFYFGIEYVDANTLYALKSETLNQTTELVKIDISNTNNPIISTLMNLTNSSALSFNPYSMVNQNYAYVQTDYDKCDNSFYFTYTNPIGNDAEPYLVEIKLNSNTINEYYNTSVIGKYYFGLDHLR
jgi:hypothetical protein